MATAGLLCFATGVSFRDARGGESVRIAPSVGVGSRVRVTSVLEAAGKLRLNADGRGVQEVPVTIEGRLGYVSQRLAADADHRGRRAIRRYEEAAGRIHIRKWEIATSLGASRRVVAVDRHPGRPLTYYSPLGPLTTQDLDVVSIQFDPLVVDELIPGGRYEPGDSWKVAPTLLATLFGLDAVLESDLRGQVSAIDDRAVRVELQGKLEGTIDGVTSRLEVRGKLRWDRARQRVSWIAVQFRERRDISHTAPGFDTKARLRVEISPYRGDVVTDAGLRRRAMAGPTPPDLLVALVSPTGFELLHSRQWKLVIDGPDVTVLRMIRQGELIAQANLVRLNDGRQLTLAEFQREVRQALGDQFRQWVTAEEKQDGDIHHLHVVAAGEASGLAVQWIYHHVHDGRNRRATVAFTVESKLMERFAGEDEQIVSTLKLTQPAEPAPSKETDAAAPRQAKQGVESPRRQ